MIKLKMPVKEAIQSKAMIAGIFLCGVGAYLIYKGDSTTGMLAIGNGMGIMGIRDSHAG